MVLKSTKKRGMVIKNMYRKELFGLKRTEKCKIVLKSLVLNLHCKIVARILACPNHGVYAVPT